MSLKPLHRYFLLGLLVLGCIELAYTRATGDAQEERISWPAIVDLKTANFVTVCTQELIKAGTCDATAANLVAARFVEVGKIFAGHEFNLPQAKLRVAFKGDVVRLGRMVGFAGPAVFLTELEDQDPVVIVNISELSGTAAGRVGKYNFGDSSLVLNPSVLSDPTGYGIVHELFHAVQAVYIPQVTNERVWWILDGTAEAAEVAVLTTDLNLRRNVRVSFQWRDWSFPLSSTADEHEYEVAEFFLEAEAGSLHYMKALFRCLNSAWPIRNPLQSYADPIQGYAIMEACPFFNLESSYLNLIARRSTQDYPYEGAPWVRASQDRQDRLVGCQPQLTGHIG
jgi:hypothetical protein